jgi:O-antigen/teichoic acid export membrane protein
MVPSSAQPAQKPRLVVQAFWLTFSKITAALVNIVVPIFLARVMSQTEYGIYKQVFLFVGTAVSMSALGVGTSAFYFLPRRPSEGGAIVLNVVLYNLLTGAIPLVLILVYPNILTDVFKVPDVQKYAIALGVLIILQAIAGFLHQVPSALQDVKSSTLLIIGSQVSRAMIFGLAAILMPNVRTIVNAAILHQLVQTSLLFWYLHRNFGRFWTHFDRTFFVEQVRYAIPIGIFGVLGVLRRDLHNYFVSAAFSPAQFAIYSVGSMQTPFVPVIVESVTTVMVVRVSELQHQGRHRDVMELTARAINRLASILFPIVALLFVTRRDLIVLMYKSAYEQSADIYAINLLLLGVAVFSLEPIIQAYKEVRGAILAIQVSVLAAMTVFLYFAIGQLGMIGAIAVAVAANIVERVAVACAAARALGATKRDLALLKDVAKVTAACIAVAIPASIARDAFHPDLILLRLAVGSVTAGMLYVLIARLFHLPGSDAMNKAWITSTFAKAVSRMRRVRS